VTDLLISILDCLADYTADISDVVYIIAVSESIQLLITFLSTQLYYQKSSTGNSYENFKTSPILDIITKITSEKALALIGILMDIFIAYKGTADETPSTVMRTFRYFIPSSEIYEGLRTSTK
jgi:hypothetical protein